MLLNSMFYSLKVGCQRQFLPICYYDSKIIVYEHYLTLGWRRYFRRDVQTRRGQIQNASRFHVRLASHDWPHLTLSS